MNMTYICKTRFLAIVGGKDVTFNPGDTIPADLAKDLGLAGKPDIAARGKA
jgi:hypothetical protein